MQLAELKTKEHGLLERKKRLEVSIQELENSASSEYIEELSTSLVQLKTQLELTETALSKAQEEQTELESFQSSKQFKELVKKQENLRKQAEEQTKAIYKKLVQLNEDMKEVSELTRNHYKVSKQLGETHCNLNMVQPFNWLKMVQGVTEKRLNDTRWFPEKLE